MKCTTRCPECRFTDNDGIWPVAGEGPPDAQVLFVNEQPGFQENNMHRPMVGKTGDELNGLYLPISGLSRSEVWIDNAVKCKYADSGEVPPPEVVKSCSEWHLKRTIQKVNPEFIVLSGGVSNSLIGLDIDTYHGTGRTTSLLGWTGKVFSTYHPALGIHLPTKMQSLLEDFEKLKLFLRGKLPPLIDAYPNPNYYRLETAEQVDEVMSWADDDVPLAIDTESRKTWNGYRSSIRYIPWSIQFCFNAGDAYLIKAEDRGAVERFAYWAKRKFRKYLMHNAPHDMRELGKLGVHLDWDLVLDTMGASYILANTPKGLKPLSLQLLGIVMRNFDDVTLPYGMQAAMEYFDRASMMEWPDPVQEPTGEMETKRCPDCKGTSVLSVGRGKLRNLYECGCGDGYITQPKMTRKQGVKQKISRLIGDYLKSPAAMDPWRRWDAWAEDRQIDVLVERLGPLPLPSVELVPEDEIMSYAGSDPHSTFRIYPVLLQRMLDLRKNYKSKVR